jgi:hypothetical protein
LTSPPLPFVPLEPDLQELTPCLLARFRLRIVDAPGEPTYPKVLINNRYVSTKPANAPFIKYAREKEEMKRRASADLAAGLPSTPKASTEGVRERAEREEWTTWDVLKRLVLVVVLLTSLGKVFTGSPVFGQEAAIKKVWATRINPVRLSSYVPFISPDISRLRGKGEQAS